MRKGCNVQRHTCTARSATTACESAQRSEAPAALTRSHAPAPARSPARTLARSLGRSLAPAHLVKLLAIVDHRFLHILGVVALGGRDDELLDLFELVNAEDARLVAPMRPSLLAEARRVSRVPAARGGRGAGAGHQCKASAQGVSKRKARGNERHMPVFHGRDGT